MDASILVEEFTYMYPTISVDVIVILKGPFIIKLEEYILKCPFKIK
jgi:hypothetical protein